MVLTDIYNSPLFVLAAGAAGGVSRVALADALSRAQKIAHLIAGTLMALFIAPALVDVWFSSSPVSVRLLAAFGSSFAGPLIAEALVRQWEKRGDQIAGDVIDGISRRVTGNQPTNEGNDK